MALNVICSLRAEKEGKMEAEGKVRKQYKKPQVSQVKLEIEETVLAGCKAYTVKGRNATPCKIGTGGGDCQTVLGS